MRNFQRVRGNLVFSDDDGNAVYEDGVPFDNSRPCVSCGIVCGEDEPDPCLGWLAGVDYACCGHGDPTEEYVIAGKTEYRSVEEWRGVHLV